VFAVSNRHAMMNFSSSNFFSGKKLLIALLGGRNLLMLYFVIYSLLTTTVTIIAKMFNISFINQSLLTKGNKLAKYLLFTSLLSLGGLPPLIGFLPR
jgi:NADH-ubiquinone oxidoreductase chain 2